MWRLPVFLLALSNLEASLAAQGLGSADPVLRPEVRATPSLQTQLRKDLGLALRAGDLTLSSALLEELVALEKDRGNPKESKDSKALRVYAGLLTQTHAEEPSQLPAAFVLFDTKAKEAKQLSVKEKRLWDFHRADLGERLLGERKKARKTFETLLSEDPNFTRAREALARLDALEAADKRWAAENEALRRQAGVLSTHKPKQN